MYVRACVYCQTSEQLLLVGQDPAKLAEPGHLHFHCGSLRRSRRHNKYISWISKSQHFSYFSSKYVFIQSWTSIIECLVSSKDQTQIQRFYFYFTVMQFTMKNLHKLQLYSYIKLKLLQMFALLTWTTYTSSLPLYQISNFFTSPLTFSVIPTAVICQDTHTHTQPALHHVTHLSRHTLAPLRCVASSCLHPQ